MKKISIALMAVALMTLSACKDDDPQPVNPGNNNPTPGRSDPQPSEQSLVDGVYRPDVHISEIFFSNAEGEQWNWNNGLLQTVVNSESGTPKVSFSYLDNRLQQMTMETSDAFAGQVNLQYNADRLSSFSINASGVEALSASVLRSSDGKISGADINLDAALLSDVFDALMGEFAGANGNGFPGQIDDINSNIRFQWDANNIKQYILNINAQMTTTLGQFAETIGDLSQLGEMGGMLQQLASIMPDKDIYLRISMSDTLLCEYDSHTNPFQNYYGNFLQSSGNNIGFNVSTLSANNLTREEHHTGSHLTVLATLMTADPQEVFSRDIPGETTTKTYTYRYDERNLPETIEDSEDNITTITYLD